MSLLILLCLWCGFHLGIMAAIHTIETRYPTTWELLGLEMKVYKQERADAAREKEAGP